MARQAVEVRECDRCGKVANTWVIIGPDGAPREIELCDRHGAPIANAYALGRPVARRTVRGGTTRATNRRTEDPPPTTNTSTLPPAPPEPMWR